MKNQSNPIRRLLAATTLASGLALSSAQAGGLDANAIFVAADLDISGTLSLGEFTTTLDAGVSARAALKKFRGADRNVNGSIELTEFLIFTGTIPKPTKIEELFDQTDTNADASINFDEFTATFKAKASLVSIRRHFVRADVDASGGISETEWEDFKRGRGQAGINLTVFELADFNADNQLTVVEYGYIFPRIASEAKVLAKFNKLDDDDNGVLVTAEFNPGVRAGR